MIPRVGEFFVGQKVVYNDTIMIIKDFPRTTMAVLESFYPPKFGQCSRMSIPVAWLRQHLYNKKHKEQTVSVA